VAHDVSSNPDTVIRNGLEQAGWPRRGPGSAR
jgi:hypothetical protein